jgi:hypothetical protein
MTDTDKEQFEIERISAMRTFEVATITPYSTKDTVEQFFAHFHDTDESGNLRLTTIEADGRHLIRHMFNARSWTRLTEIGHATTDGVKVH